jgi:hypothetical protein
MDQDSSVGNETEGGLRARAIVVVTVVSARAAQPSEADQRSISIEPDRRLAYSSLSRSAAAPNQHSRVSAPEEGWNSEQPAGDRTTTWQ